VFLSILNLMQREKIYMEGNLMAFLLAVLVVVKAVLVLIMELALNDTMASIVIVVGALSKDPFVPMVRIFWIS
jgi:uncharacterized membrane protein YhhN